MYEQSYNFNTSSSYYPIAIVDQGPVTILDQGLANEEIVQANGEEIQGNEEEVSEPSPSCRGQRLKRFGPVFILVTHTLFVPVGFILNIENYESKGHHIEWKPIGSSTWYMLWYALFLFPYTIIALVMIYCEARTKCPGVAAILSYILFGLVCMNGIGLAEANV